MSLKEQLTADMKAAMKAKDKSRLAVIRMLRAAIQNEEIRQGDTLSEDDVMTVLSKELKQRKDSFAEFQKAGRDDLMAQQEYEISVIQSYLPEPLTEEELKAIVVQAITNTQATSMKDMGRIMSEVLPQIKGRADGAQVNQLVKTLLQ